MKHEAIQMAPAEQRLPMASRRDPVGRSAAEQVQDAVAALPPAACHNREQDPEGHKAVVAYMAADTSMQNGGIIQAYRRDGIGAFGKDLDIRVLVNDLDEASKQVGTGDMTELERMLIAQATSLQAIYSTLAQRAQREPTLSNMERFLSLALKAQSQSRCTLQALVELKLPKQVAFIKQSNIAHGHQQVVNNGAGTARTGKTKQLRQDKVLALGNGSANLDTGAATKTERSNRELEAVGVVHRAAKRGG